MELATVEEPDDHSAKDMESFRLFLEPSVTHTESDLIKKALGVTCEFGELGLEAHSHKHFEAFFGENPIL